MISTPFIFAMGVAIVGLCTFFVVFTYLDFKKR
jgi:hypothetical protein